MAVLRSQLTPSRYGRVYNTLVRSGIGSGVLANAFTGLDFDGWLDGSPDGET